MNKSESKYFNTAVKMNKALISLLDEKEFEYITISEICKRAGVNRSTFYLHYDNIGDLLEETTNYILNSFTDYFSFDLQKITDKFEHCELDELNFISEEYLYPYLSYIKDNKKVFLTAFQHKNAFGFDAIFQRLFENIFDPILKRFNYPINDRKYVMMFYLNGITAVVMMWLKDDCKKTLREVSGIIHECIFGLENSLQINKKG